MNFEHLIQINDLQKLEKLNGHLSQQLGRSPTFDELAAHIDATAANLPGSPDEATISRL